MALDRLSLDDIAPFSRKKLSQPSQPTLGTLTEDCPMDAAAATPGPADPMVLSSPGEAMPGHFIAQPQNERVTSPTTTHPSVIGGIRAGGGIAAPRSALRAPAARTPSAPSAATTPGAAARGKIGGSSALGATKPLTLDPSSTPLSQQVRRPL